MIRQVEAWMYLLHVWITSNEPCKWFEYKHNTQKHSLLLNWFQPYQTPMLIYADYVKKQHIVLYTCAVTIFEIFGGTYSSSLNLKNNGYLIRSPALLYVKRHWMKLIRLYTTCLDYKIDTNAMQKSY
jgi:hypothetical protein